MQRRQISHGPAFLASVTNARVSATASVELLFAPEYDPVAKLAVTQFPDV